ncbi:unnamed protein product [Camellia sinensis]
MESGSGNGDSEVRGTMLELLNQLDGFEHLTKSNVPSDHLQNSGLDTSSSADYAETINNLCPMLEKGTGTVAVSPDLGGLVKGGSSDSVEASTLGIQPKHGEGNLNKENQTQMFENEFGKLLPALCRSRAESSGTSGKGSQAQKM